MKLKYAILIAVVAALLAVTVVFAIGASKQKCHTYYDGSTKAAKICVTGYFYWQDFPPYAVTCNGQPNYSYTAFNGYSFSNQVHSCNNYANHSNARATATIWSPPPGSLPVWYESGPYCIGYDGNPGTISCFVFNP